MQHDRPDDMDFIPELLELMPLSARDVLICDGPALARAYRLLNPTARITAIGAADPEVVDDGHRRTCRDIAENPGLAGRSILSSSMKRLAP